METQNDNKLQKKLNCKLILFQDIENIIVSIKDKLDSIICDNRKTINKLVIQKFLAIEELLDKRDCDIDMNINIHHSEIKIYINNDKICVKLLKDCDDNEISELNDNIDQILNIIMKQINIYTALLNVLENEDDDEDEISSEIVKYKLDFLSKVANGQIKISTGTGGTGSTALSVGVNLDISNLSGPQSETSIAFNPQNISQIIAGSNDIYRRPMDAYLSKNGGGSWAWIQLPLPNPIRTGGSNFGSDPSVVFSNGNAYYSYIVVYTNSNFSVLQGSSLAIAKINPTNNSVTATYLNIISGVSVFNDKPLIVADNYSTSPYKGRIYVAWDTITNYNYSTSNAILLAYSNDGINFTKKVITNGPAVIGAMPFVSPNGMINIVWHDGINNAIMIKSSNNGGVSFGSTYKISSTIINFNIYIPPQQRRGVLVYPVGAVSNDGTLFCCWIDLANNGYTNIFFSKSTNGGVTWSQKKIISDNNGASYQFNPWLSVDPTNNSLNISWRDTRNDPAGKKVDVYYTKSTNNGDTFSPNQKISNMPSDETGNNANINQYGDYEGNASYGGKTIMCWSDSRYLNTLNEEIFVAII